MFFSSYGCGMWICGTLPNVFDRQKLNITPGAVHQVPSLKDFVIRRIRSIIMNVTRVHLREDNRAVSVPYSPITFEKSMIMMMEHFHKEPTSHKFQIIFDCDETYFQCNRIRPAAPDQKFSIRIMTAMLLFVQLFDSNFFSNAMAGINYLFENRRFVQGWYFRTRLQKDLLKNERGQSRFFRDWQFNTFTTTCENTYLKFRSLLKLPAPPVPFSRLSIISSFPSAFVTANFAGPTARRIAPFATVHRIENNSDNSEQNDDETDDELPELDGY